MKIGRHSGFTLVEVLIALVIVAIALASGVKMVGQYTHNLIGVQERTWAHWVAMNNLVDLQISEKWPDKGAISGSETETPYAFLWEREVHETAFERVRRVEIQILHPNQPDQFIVRHNLYTGQNSSW